MQEDLIWDNPEARHSDFSKNTVELLVQSSSFSSQLYWRIFQTEKNLMDLASQSWLALQIFLYKIYLKTDRFRNKKNL